MQSAPTPIHGVYGVHWRSHPTGRTWPFLHRQLSRCNPPRFRFDAFAHISSFTFPPTPPPDLSSRPPLAFPRTTFTAIFRPSIATRPIKKPIAVAILIPPKGPSAHRRGPRRRAHQRPGRLADAVWREEGRRSSVYRASRAERPRPCGDRARPDLHETSWVGAAAALARG